MPCFTIFFPPYYSLKSGVYFSVMENLNLDAKFSSELLDSYLELMKYTVKKYMYTPKLF